MLFSIPERFANLQDFCSQLDYTRLLKNAWTDDEENLQGGPYLLSTGTERKTIKKDHFIEPSIIFLYLTRCFDRNDRYLSQC